MQKNGKPLKIKKKRGIFFKITISFFIFLIILILPVLAFLAFSAFDSAKPPDHIPDNHYAYVNLPSAGIFFQKILSLKTMDSFLASPEMAKAQGTIRYLRSSTFFSSVWFKIATNVRLDTAVYSKTNVLVFAKLGFRSAITRLLPIILKIKPDLLSSMKELEIVNENNLTIYKYKISEEIYFYTLFYKDAIISASSKELLFKALAKNERKNIESVKSFIKNSKSGSINILTDINYFTQNTKKDDTPLNNFLQKLNFNEGGIVNLIFDNIDIYINGNCKWETKAESIKKILSKKTSVPAILNRLPKTVTYYSILNIGDLKFLFENGQDFLGKDIIQSYNSASKASRFVFNKDIEDLVFSWVGEEFGVFGVDQSESPIFFTALKNEERCRNTFEDVFSSLLINQDVSAIVDGLRIPRIEFPAFLKNLLRAFGLNLPTPFYVIKDGFLYLSENAESLASMINEVWAGNLLVKTEKWKTISSSFTPESSVLVYYTLENQIPFFLRASKELVYLLKDYNKGLLSIKFDKEQNLRFQFYSQKAESGILSQTATFPYDCKNKVTSNIYCGIAKDNTPYAYWTSNQTVYRLNLADKSLKNIKLDDTAYLTIEYENDKIKAIWAVSEMGTIYKTDFNLNTYKNFPILTGERFATKPLSIKEKMIIPIANKPNLLFVEDNGNIFYSNSMNKKLTQTPYVYQNFIAAIPRSFDSTMFVFDLNGAVIEEYTTYLDSISAVQPILFTDSKGNLSVAILTEAGTFSIRNLNKNSKENIYSIELNTAFRSQPIYSSSLKKFFLISDKGDLYKINTECQIIDKISLKQKNEKDYKITLLDLNNDKLDDILVSGGGNAIYAYTPNFTLYRGFPVSGTGIPYFIDVDGDKKADLITCGIDNKIHAYTGGLLNLK